MSYILPHDEPWSPRGLPSRSTMPLHNAAPPPLPVHLQPPFGHRLWHLLPLPFHNPPFGHRLWRPLQVAAALEDLVLTKVKGSLFAKYILSSMAMAPISWC